MLKKRYLITGAGGFVGMHVCQVIRSSSASVYTEIAGVDIQEPPQHSCNTFHVVDACCANDMENILEQEHPDYILHFAGAFGGGDSQAAYRVNILSLTVLLEALKKQESRAILITTGSAAEYGKVPGTSGVSEESQCFPVTAYGLSKLLATYAALNYFRAHGVRVTVVRPFQLIGKGVTSLLVPGSLAMQIADVMSRGGEVIKVGNLDSFRDFLDIRDFAEAVLGLCHKPDPGGIFNVCSGKPVKISDLLQTMIDVSGVKARIEVEPARLRGTADVPIIFGSTEKMLAHCGWKPKITLRESVESMFNPENPRISLD